MSYKSSASVISERDQYGDLRNCLKGIAKVCGEYRIEGQQKLDSPDEWKKPVALRQCTVCDHKARSQRSICMYVHACLYINIHAYIQKIRRDGISSESGHGCCIMRPQGLSAPIARKENKTKLFDFRLPFLSSNTAISRMQHYTGHTQV